MGQLLTQRQSDLRLVVRRILRTGFALSGGGRRHTGSYLCWLVQEVKISMRKRQVALQLLLSASCLVYMLGVSSALGYSARLVSRRIATILLV